MAEAQLHSYAGDMLQQLGDIVSDEEQYSVNVIGIPFKKDMASVEGGNFENMIQMSEFDDALFIFNGNQKCDTEANPKAGGGSAIIRPYSTPQHNYKALPIPTGWATGIEFKTIKD